MARKREDMIKIGKKTQFSSTTGRDAAKRRFQLEADKRTIAEAIQAYIEYRSETTGKSNLDELIDKSLKGDVSVKDLKTLAEVLGQFTNTIKLENLPNVNEIMNNGAVKERRNN